MASKVAHPEFARRMEEACDGNSRVPAPNYGRLKWFVDEMERRFGTSVTNETIRKWFAGETRPRHKMIGELAAILQVDPVWLEYGMANPIPQKEAKVRNAIADGAVNVVTGLIQIDGGAVAFPSEKDREQSPAVDIYAVIRGAKYSITVVIGEAVEGGWKFSVDRHMQDNVILGVVLKRNGSTALRVIELPWEAIEANGNWHDGHYDVVVPDDIPEPWRQVRSFKERI